MKRQDICLNDKDNMMVLRRVGVQTLGNQLPIFKVAHDKVKMALDLFLLWVKPITLGKECYMGY
jgi:hypothetical protein